MRIFCMGFMPFFDGIFIIIFDIHPESSFLIFRLTYSSFEYNASAIEDN